MHKMDDTPKLITILGLCLEGFSMICGIVVILFLNASNVLTDITAESLEMSESEFSYFMEIINIGLIIIYGALAVFFVVFLVNLILFIPMIKGNYTESKARNVYLYQAIWGGLNLFSNTLVGILYLVSGIQGRKGRREEKDIREGI